ASARATCTARSAARGRRGRPPRGTCAGAPCRTSRSSFSTESLRELDRVAGDLDAVARRVEDPPQVDAAARLALQLAENLRVERADDCAELAAFQTDTDGHFAV